jgi:hypothetical protein
VANERGWSARTRRRSTRRGAIGAHSPRPHTVLRNLIELPPRSWSNEVQPRHRSLSATRQSGRPDRMAPDHRHAQPPKAPPTRPRSRLRAPPGAHRPLSGSAEPLTCLRRPKTDPLAERSRATSPVSFSATDLRDYSPTAGRRASLPCASGSRRRGGSHCCSGRRASAVPACPPHYRNAREAAVTALPRERYSARRRGKRDVDALAAVPVSPAAHFWPA